MTQRLRRPLLFLTATVVATVCLSAAAPQVPSSGAGTAALTQPIPIDPQIAVGRLQNGLRYYIRANKKPEQRAELRLVVNAGSILEDDDQQGMAHLVEHMAFNGTKHFPKQDVVSFMQSIGMRFGPHVNAYTSFDETVYMLQVPTDKPEALDKAMLILEDWAHDITFDPAEVEQERNVVMEEWRLGRGASTRMQDKTLPVLLEGSRYAERLPIGKPEIIQHGSIDRLKKFYTDWYRPDLMAVVAVGDFDKPSMEALIKRDFDPLPAPEVPRLRPTYKVPDHSQTLFAIATDKEATSSSVSVYSLMPARDQATVGAYRRQIVEGLFSSMLSARFAEIAQKPDAPFLRAGAGQGLLVRPEEASTLQASVKDGGIDNGLGALFTEAARVRQFGFTQTELDRQKERALRSLAQAVAEKDTEDSSGFAAEYIRNFLQREPIPGIVYEDALYRRFIPEITLAEVNGLAANWAGDHDQVVVVEAPDKPGLTTPSPADLSAVMKTASSQTLTAYADTVGNAPLLATPPTGGRVVNTTTKDEFGITEWTLSNGVKVVLEPTTYKEDEIQFRAESLGGTSLATDQDFIPARTAAQVVSAGGLGAFSDVDLRKVLAGKIASARPSISELETDLSGGASGQDLETLFQLIYLRFTEPRKDPQAFAALTAQMKAAYANQEARPEYVFGVTLNALLTQDHLRARPMTAALVDQMDLDKSMAFYKERFADAGGFTFTFVGSFNLQAIKPLVERYLGGLPSLHRNESWKDVGIHFPTGVVTKSVEKGVEPKSEAVIVFTGPFEYTQDQRVAIRAMGDVLENRLRDVLREKLGGTYSVSVGPNYTKIPRVQYAVQIAFGCSPTRTNELVKAVFDEIHKLQAAPPTATEVSDIKETFLRENETNLKTNGYLLQQVSLRYRVRRGPDEPVPFGRLLRQAHARDRAGGGHAISERAELRRGDALPAEDRGVASAGRARAREQSVASDVRPAGFATLRGRVRRTLCNLTPVPRPAAVISGRHGSYSDDPAIACMGRGDDGKVEAGRGGHRRTGGISRGPGLRARTND